MYIQNLRGRAARQKGTLNKSTHDLFSAKGKNTRHSPKGGDDSEHFRGQCSGHTKQKSCKNLVVKESFQNNDNRFFEKNYQSNYGGKSAYTQANRAGQKKIVGRISLDSNWEINFCHFPNFSPVVTNL